MDWCIKTYKMVQLNLEYPRGIETYPKYTLTVNFISYSFSFCYPPFHCHLDFYETKIKYNFTMSCSFYFYIHFLVYIFIPLRLPLPCYWILSFRNVMNILEKSVINILEWRYNNLCPDAGSNCRINISFQFIETQIVLNLVIFRDHTRRTALRSELSYNFLFPALFYDS